MMRFATNTNEVVVSYTLKKLTLCVGYFVGDKVGGLYVGFKVWTIDRKKLHMALAEGLHSNILVVTAGSRQQAVLIKTYWIYCRITSWLELQKHSRKC